MRHNQQQLRRHSLRYQKYTPLPPHYHNPQPTGNDLPVLVPLQGFAEARRHFHRIWSHVIEKAEGRSTIHASPEGPKGVVGYGLASAASQVADYF